MSYNPYGPDSNQPQTGPLPPAPTPPGAVPPGSVPPPAGAPTSKIPLIALIVAIVGTVFACIPGILIVGWILLPIAFILAIVALVKPGPKKLAVSALVVSIVGTIAGIGVFVGVVGGAVDDALEELDQATETSAPAQSEPAEQAESDGEAEPADEPADEPAGEEGTRANPLPLGTEITSKDWRVTINSVTANANEEVMAANQFNEEPAPGTQYLLVNLTATYLGEDKGLDGEVSVAFVNADGTVSNSYDAPVVGPEPMFGANELYKDASSTGNVVIQVPEGADGLLRVTPGFVMEEVFVQLS